MKLLNVAPLTSPWPDHPRWQPQGSLRRLRTRRRATLGCRIETLSRTSCRAEKVPHRGIGWLDSTWARTFIHIIWHSRKCHCRVLPKVHSCELNCLFHQKAVVYYVQEIILPFRVTARLPLMNELKITIHLSTASLWRRHLISSSFSITHFHMGRGTNGYYTECAN